MGVFGAGDERVPLVDALPGFGIFALPEDWTAVEAFLLIKCLDNEGNPTWAYRTTHRPNREELLGALTVHVGVLRRELISEWGDDDQE